MRVHASLRRSTRRQQRRAPKGSLQLSYVDLVLIIGCTFCVVLLISSLSNARDRLRRYQSIRLDRRRSIANEVRLAAVGTDQFWDSADADASGSRRRGGGVGGADLAEAGVVLSERDQQTQAWNALERRRQDLFRDAETLLGVRDSAEGGELDPDERERLEAQAEAMRRDMRAAEERMRRVIDDEKRELAERASRASQDASKAARARRDADDSAARTPPPPPDRTPRFIPPTPYRAPHAAAGALARLPPLSEKLALKVAGSTGAVCLTWANAAAVDFVQNTVERARGAGMRNVLVGALDDASALRFNRSGFPAFRPLPGSPEEADVASIGSEEVDYDSPEMSAMGRYKVAIVKQLLDYNLTVLVADADIAWLANPWPFLAAASRRLRADVLIASDHLTPTQDDSAAASQRLAAADAFAAAKGVRMDDVIKIDDDVFEAAGAEDDLDDIGGDFSVAATGADPSKAAAAAAAAGVAGAKPQIGNGTTTGTNGTELANRRDAAAAEDDLVASVAASLTAGSKRTHSHAKMRDAGGARADHAQPRAKPPPTLPSPGAKNAAGEDDDDDGEGVKIATWKKKRGGNDEGEDDADMPAWKRVAREAAHKVMAAANHADDGSVLPAWRRGKTPSKKADKEAAEVEADAAAGSDGDGDAGEDDEKGVDGESKRQGHRKDAVITKASRRSLQWNGDGMARWRPPSPPAPRAAGRRRRGPKHLETGDAPDLDLDSGLFRRRLLERSGAEGGGAVDGAGAGGFAHDEGADEAFAVRPSPRWSPLTDAEAEELERLESTRGATRNASENALPSSSAAASRRRLLGGVDRTARERAWREAGVDALPAAIVLEGPDALSSDLSTSLLYLRPTPRAKRLVAAWLESLRKSPSTADQDALNALLRRPPPTTTDAPDGLPTVIEPASPRSAAAEAALEKAAAKAAARAWGKKAALRAPPISAALEAYAPRLRGFRGFGGGVTFGILPVDRFFSGHTYSVQQLHVRGAGRWEQLEVEARPPRFGPISVHASYALGGLAGRRERLREAKLWRDHAGYYKDGKYLSIDLDVLTPPAALVSSRDPSPGADSSLVDHHLAHMLHQLKQVKAGMAVASALKRAFILPALQCWCDLYWGHLEACRAPGAIAMQLPFDCPADLVFNLATFEAPAVNMPPIVHREAGFLSNPRLHESVLHSMAIFAPHPKATAASMTELPRVGVHIQRSVTIPPNTTVEDLADMVPRLAPSTVRVHLRAPALAVGPWNDPDAEREFDARFYASLTSWCCRAHANKDGKFKLESASYAKLLKSPPKRFADILEALADHTDRFEREDIVHSGL